MLCIQCKKNQITTYKLLQICNSCYSGNYKKNHPEKFNYKYGGMKTRAFKRDNFTCQICGEQNIKKLLIHHLDGNGSSKNNKKLLTKKQNNKLNNLITVCYKCHNKIHKPNKKINQWAKEYKQCVQCGSKTIKHAGKGLCQNCYFKKNGYTEKYKQYKKEWYQARGKYLEKLREIKKNLSTCNI